MNRHLTPINGSPRRRRSARPLPLYTVVPEVRTAAASSAIAAAVRTSGTTVYSGSGRADRRRRGLPLMGVR